MMVPVENLKYNDEIVVGGNTYVIKLIVISSFVVRVAAVRQGDLLPFLFNLGEKVDKQ